MPEKDRLTDSEMLERRRDFTRMRRSPLGRRLSNSQTPPFKMITSDPAFSFQPEQTQPFTRQTQPTFRVEPNTRTAPPNQLIPTPTPPSQLTPQQNRRIQNIFSRKITGLPRVTRPKSYKKLLEDLTKEKKEKEVRELMPKKKRWKPKWVEPKSWKKDGRNKK